MEKKLFFSLAFIALIMSCKTPRPVTLGDPSNAESFGYHPIDPLPVKLDIDSKIQPMEVNKYILNSLPDETMRLAIGQIEGSGSISYGPAKLGYKGSSYIVVLDYIKFDTKSFQVKIEKTSTSTELKSLASDQVPDAIIPTYVGVGLRLTAQIKVNEGKVDLGNLFALGVAAEAKKVTGTLVIQTLGISGESISTIIPMPSEINTTTIQNAILALGAIKTKIYEDDIQITPRVVGVYNNVGGGQKTINSFIGNFLQNPVLLSVYKRE